MSTPKIWQWDGEAMWPIRHFIAQCNRDFVIGERYRMTEIEERSEASHNHFFARLHDLWLSLPDEMVTEFPTETALRKRALIMTGFRREKRWVASSKEEARKMAAWLRPEADEDDGYALISINENVVIRWTALSQSKTGMPVKGQFHESKTKVLEWIEDLIGVKDSGEARELKGHPLVDTAAPITQPLGPEENGENDGTGNEHRGDNKSNTSDRRVYRSAADLEHRADDHPGSGGVELESLGTRLRGLATKLFWDSPAAFERAWAAEKATPEAKALYRAAPKQVEDLQLLCAQQASGRFTFREFGVGLDKIVAAAEETK